MSNAAFALSCVGLNGSSATKSVTVIVTDAITTLPLSQTFALHLDQKELGSVSNGRSITPAVGPSGVLRLRGKGIVNFASTANDQGVSFGPGGQQNAHSAAYDFPLSATEFQSLLSEAGGEIDATLVSKFDYAARAKGVPAQNNDHHLETIVSAHNGAKPVLDLTFDQWTHLTFMAQAPGADPFSYNVPAGLEDVLFGKDKVLKLRLTWDGSAERLYMNNVLVASHAYTRQPIAWGTKSDLVVGAAPHPVYGPGFRALMDTLDELSISQVVSGTTTPSTTIRY
jgi:hypothetical protein